MILEFAEQTQLFELAALNDKAIKKALKIGKKLGPSTTRPAWVDLFQKTRVANKPVDEVIKGVTLRTGAGKIYNGPFIKGHPELLEKAKKDGFRGTIRLVESDPHFGYKTNRQPFVSRDEGKRIARRAHQLPPEFNPKWTLHSSDLK